MCHIYLSYVISLFHYVILSTLLVMQLVKIIVTINIIILYIMNLNWCKTGIKLFAMGVVWHQARE